MGRHAKSPDLKLVSGNPGKRAAKLAASVTLANPRTKPPTYLPAVAKELWKEMLPQLVADRFVATIDLHTLATWCEAMATAREASAMVEQEGGVVLTPHGPVVNPWCKIRTDASTRAWKAAAILGIGQLNRQRLQQIPESNDKASDPEERFFAKVVG